MSRADDIAQAFYEDPDLRGSLTDDEADVLLRWASEQAARLDASGADDAAFAELSGQLRRLVRQINDYAGDGLYTPPAEQAAALTAIAEGAQGIGLTAAPTFSAQAAPADPMTALTGLLNSLAPAAAPAADNAPVEAQAVHAEPEAPEPEPPSAPPPFDEDFHDL